jgi:D-alanyl-D-alanine carboxypeptidase/D-alanyl-D-alanine-endopeptidase (penicillin-binding protein 4)
MRRGLCAFLLLAWCAAAHADPSRWPAALRSALADSGIAPAGAGLIVQEVDSPHSILEWNADRPFTPASTMKLLTTLAALDMLGPAYTWRTEVYTDGVVHDDTLDGNLVLKGYGDPELTLEKFWLLLRDVRARGIREIRGDVVTDRSFFALEATDPGQFDNDPTRAYNVLPDALLVNHKSVRLQFVPQEEAGGVHIIAAPDLPPITIINQLALGAGNCAFWPDKPQILPEQARLVFTGVFPKGCGERVKSFSLLTPNEYLAALFQQTWAQLGGTLTGTVRDGALPDGARLLTTWESAPLGEVIRTINKFSNNVMARNVYLTLGLAADNPPVTTHTAERAVREWLQRNKLLTPELVLENGSGLSRVERISPRSLSSLLQFAWRSPSMPEYLASLPIAGVDGTLRQRLGGSPAAGRAHIKSGYLDGVRAIAGYVQDANGRMLVVVAMVNHPNAVNAQPFFDALTEWIWARDSGPPGRQQPP